MNREGIAKLSMHLASPRDESVASRSSSIASAIDSSRSATSSPRCFPRSTDSFATPSRSKTLVIGRSGFLGRHFYEAYSKQDQNIVGTQHKSPSEAFYFDLKNSTLDQLPIEGCGYTHAIIGAAIGNVRCCELNPKESYFVNVEKTLELSQELIKRNITPIVFSTGYVFDGKTGCYSEDWPLSPINVNGAQKAELERVMERNCKGNYLIIRLNKVFTFETNDGTLFAEMYSKLMRNEIVKAAYNQIFSPIFIDEVIAATNHLQNLRATGLFNICGSEAVSRLELTKYMASLLSKSSDLVQSISIDDLGDNIRRSNRTDLCCNKLYSVTQKQPLKSIKRYMEAFVNKHKYL